MASIYGSMTQCFVPSLRLMARLWNQANPGTATHHYWFKASCSVRSVGETLGIYGVISDLGPLIYDWSNCSATTILSSWIALNRLVSVGSYCISTRGVMAVRSCL